MEELEILQDIFFVLLYGGVIMLSVVAALYLLLRRSNAIAPEVTSPVRLRRWAAAFLIATALSHMSWLYYAYHTSLTVYTIVCFLDLLMLTPSMTGVLLSMLQDRHRSVWPVLILLIPAFILSTLCVIRENSAFFIPASIYIYAVYAGLMLYMFFAVRRYGRWLRDNYADLEHKEVWQSFLILVVFLLFFVMYSSTSEGSSVLVYLLQIDCIIIAALLLWRVETLQQLSENPSPEADPAEDAQEPPAPMDTLSKIGSLLKKECENGQLYLQHDLTLAQLAQTIGTNRYYLSQHFAQRGLTFNAYINDLRVDHFIRLYRGAAAENRIVTAQQLAFESGFHSYSTFSSAFKQKTGKTVTAWMQAPEE